MAVDFGKSHNRINIVKYDIPDPYLNSGVDSILCAASLCNFKVRVCVCE
jgi:hypothetical protein